MATRAETTRAEARKKGPAPKRAKKLSQRKATKTSRTGPKIVDAPRTKRDAQLASAHERVANSPEERARRAKRKATRVRANATR